MARIAGTDTGVSTSYPLSPRPLSMTNISNFVVNTTACVRRVPKYDGMGSHHTQNAWATAIILVVRCDSQIQGIYYHVV